MYTVIVLEIFDVKIVYATYHRILQDIMKPFEIMVQMYNSPHFLRYLTVQYDFLINTRLFHSLLYFSSEL